MSSIWFNDDQVSAMEYEARKAEDAENSVASDCSSAEALSCNAAFQKHLSESHWGDNLTQSARFDFWEIFQAGWHYGQLKARQ